VRLSLKAHGGAADLGANTRPFLSQEGEQIDFFYRLQVMQGIEATGEQEFAQQGIQFGDVLR
jgi:hypothetical protein